ncbi:GNAT family N-acetyltransferase [Niveispirillum sp. KHB5.9]|uniref:GNAT family N-acetyltransferase n=1 Tax=Niveispirillum sp. KHB5.9 TaxID=3400269 RepID=UPI003A899E2E
MLAASLIRPATAADAAGIANVHVESWRSTYPGMLPDRYLVGLSTATHERRWRGLLSGSAPPRGRRTFVAQGPGGRILGFASCGPQRTGLPGFGGEFYALYLLDQAQGQGLGRRFLAAMAQHLLAGDTQSAVVWVLRDNPSRYFYERLGGDLLAEQPISFAGAKLTEVAYGWTDLVPLARLAADPPVGG